jgi:hypothetical protein
MEIIKIEQLDLCKMQKTLFFCYWKLLVLHFCFILFLILFSSNFCIIIFWEKLGMDSFILKCRPLTAEHEKEMPLGPARLLRPIAHLSAHCPLPNRFVQSWLSDSEAAAASPSRPPPLAYRRRRDLSWIRAKLRRSLALPLLIPVARLSSRPRLLLPRNLLLHLTTWKGKAYIFNEEVAIGFLMICAF